MTSARSRTQVYSRPQATTSPFWPVKMKQARQLYFSPFVTSTCLQGDFLRHLSFVRRVIWKLNRGSRSNFVSKRTILKLSGRRSSSQNFSIGSAHWIRSGSNATFLRERLRWTRVKFFRRRIKNVCRTIAEHLPLLTPLQFRITVEARQTSQEGQDRYD